LLTTTYVSASTYLPVDDHVYHVLSYLEAQGVIESGLLTTKPLSRKEIARLTLEAEGNAEGKSIFIQNLVKSLKEEFKDEINDTRFIKPVDSVYGEYVYNDSNNQALNYNNDGDIYDKGTSLRVGLISRAELGWISFYINPEVRYSDSDTDLILKKGYGVLSFLGLDLIAGKDSQWWGPGYNGALLLSNNPEPLTFVSLTNPQPVLLPWILEYLGPFRFTVFATRLEKNRNDVPEPILWGMRLNFKPHPYLEVGLERTAIFGGQGRSESLTAWWRSFTGVGENKTGVDSGDQRAGFDLKLTIPFQLQPLQLYVEADGEDEAGGWPSKWAYLTGIYLPRILNIERVGLRAEYATTHVSGFPNVWYTHYIYTSGYTYKGRIIGHHMGTDSNDIFLELSYLIPEQNGRISISYDREEHNLSGTVKEKTDEGSLRIYIRLIKGFDLETEYSYGKIENMNNVPDNNKDLNLIIGKISYNF
jgi:hypothetical protein